MKKMATLMAAVSLMASCPGQAATPDPHGNKKILVAYFSCTGNTKRVAEAIASETGGVLYRIRPEQPYTSADLNWNDENSRSSLEMKNPSSRPALADKRAKVEAYDVVFVGYPIWWYTHPTIINTFIEAYDFKGKQVIPFATSGGSSITQSEESLRKRYPDIRWGSGKRLTADKKEITAWLKQVL